MLCAHCGICCTRTQMPLCEKDVKRLERLNYSKEEFSRATKVGYTRLRNRRGHCFFYDVDSRSCKVYSNRPEGCRLYPVIYDESKGIMVDEICKARASVASDEIVKKGLKVLKLIKRLDIEAQTASNKRMLKHESGSNLRNI